MILLIDNYDSFTYNLYQYLCELGADVVVARNDKISLEEIEAMAPQGIVVSPGPCTPKEAGISGEGLPNPFGGSDSVRSCLSLGSASDIRLSATPTAEWWSGRRRLCTARHRWCTTTAKGCTKASQIPFEAIRYHSLIVNPESLPEFLEVTSRTEDGIVMGLRHKSLPVEGVQFHPESIMTRVGHDLQLPEPGSRKIVCNE